ncbi:Bacteriocin (Lactococcin_972) [Plantibacter sp. VKM Ac-1784]|uniref:Bacteriocin (Lactococcin_972) n=1 Tax=Plantibacter elymi (nom. nud.) TaxID=199708 RepID=A0ABY1R811_9MICO|nr:lactococcin 972 family bacteriocin [Plantibacter sp. VKM Ac-1784]SMQ59446.1 Bacteriocin (Lactococcin_972) [Plantibacter sp. VKM Ac-1784]
MRWKRGAAIVALSTTLAVAGAGSAHAVTVNPPEGGTWSYGTDSPSRGTWSDYLHHGSRHHSLAGNASYERKSPVVNLGYWSEVSVETSLWGNYAKYNLD